MKEELTSQKNIFRVKKKKEKKRKKKKNMTTKDKRPLLLFYFYYFEQVSVGWVISFIFFPWLIINYKDKCIQLFY